MIQAIRAGLAIGTRQLSRAQHLLASTVRRFAQARTASRRSNSAWWRRRSSALMFAIMETAIVFFAGQTLETAVADSARLIMTGQAQSAELHAGAVQERGVRQDLGLFDCAERHEDRREDLLGTSAAVDNSKPIDANGNLKTNFGYRPAAPATSWSCG